MIAYNRVLEKYDDIMNIILPTLGNERKNILPIFYLYVQKQEKF